MRLTLPTLAISLFVGPASIWTLILSPTPADARSNDRVHLVRPFKMISAKNLSGYIAVKFKVLARIDPDRPLADERSNQTLSLFGREDLIAASSDDYKANGCSPIETTFTVLDEIADRARKTSIVIISESHERSQHRSFIAEIASRLRPLGYATLAIETLANPEPGTPAQYLSPFLKHPNLPFLTDQDGYYLSEAGFGRLGRRAKALGYRLLPYEFFALQNGGLPPDATWEQRIAVREEGQASHLAEFLGEHPGTRLLVHVGYTHATEVQRPDGTKWLAARLKEKTGIDPLTISQTICRGGGDTVRFSALPADQPVGAFDLVVDHPSARFVQGRPEWRLLAGDIAVSIPQALLPSTGWRVIEARPIGEPVTSVPMDRVAIRPGETIALMLPPGRYNLRAIDVERDERAETNPASR
ncbi:MAG: hypothetical protein K2X59_11795 [Sphingomonas sp.]|nr:hypothetical protein [Sphingomonas sp.]